MGGWIIQVTAFWIVAPCSDVLGYRRFEGLCCLHRYGEMNVAPIISPLELK